MFKDKNDWDSTCETETRIHFKDSLDDANHAPETYVVGLTAMWVGLKRANILQLQYGFNTRVDEDRRHKNAENEAWNQVVKSCKSGLDCIAGLSSLQTSRDEGILTDLECVNLQLMYCIAESAKVQKSEDEKEFDTKNDILNQPIFANLKRRFLLHSAYVETATWGKTTVAQYKKYRPITRGIKKSTKRFYRLVDPMKTPAPNSDGTLNLAPWYAIYESRIEKYIYFDHKTQTYLPRFYETGIRTKEYKEALQKDPSLEFNKEEDHKKLYPKYRMTLHQFASRLYLEARREWMELDKSDLHDLNKQDQMRKGKLYLEMQRYKAWTVTLRWTASRD